MTTQQPTPPTGPYNPMFGLQEKVASLLAPIFQDARTGELFAYQIACRSLQAFEPETRADFVNAGRTIAFGLASMVLAREVFNPALELEDKKRAAIHANALNRSADQSERSMMERRRYRRAYPMFPVPQEAEPEEEQAQVQEAVTAYAAAQPNPPQPNPPQPNPPQPNPPQPNPPQPNPPQPNPTSPEINQAPRPIQPSSIHCTGKNQVQTPPNRPEPPVTEAILRAVTPNGPPPHSLAQSGRH